VAVEMNLPNDLAERLARIVSDLEATAGVDLTFKDEPHWDHGPSCMLWEESGSGTGITFQRAANAAEDVAQLADQVQEVVIESRWYMGISPVAWPECPVHRTHPLEAVARDDEAVWVCPKDGAIRFEIGSLG
jgi:hypothetical protein